MKSVRHTILCGAVAVAVWLVTASSAQAAFFDNFDSYTLGGMNGKGGWKGWGNDPAVANMAVVNTTYASSMPNSVRIQTTAPGTYTDLVHEFSGYTSGQWLITAKQYIPSSSISGTSFYIIMSAYTDPAGPYDWAAQTTFNLATGKVGEDNGGNIPTPLNIIRNQWVELRYAVNLNANTVTEYYNGVMFSTRAWEAAASPKAIAAFDLFSLDSAVTGPVYYDDIQISVIPEPGSLTLLAGFSLIAGLWLRRKNAA